MDRKVKVHFMGIGGSGMAPLAIIAKQKGFEVSGCDMNQEGYYYDKLRDEGIEIYSGHDSLHADTADILAVTPAIFDLNPDHPEIRAARDKNILMTWQEFLGKYIQKDMKTVAIAGTHGKSTTTVLMTTVLDQAGSDPYALAGTIYKPWGSGARIGNSDIFVCEADEFNNNYHNYYPEIAIINNVEMDHPEFFRDYLEVKESFKNFIRNLKGTKILIVNEDSKGLMEIIDEMKDEIIERDIKVIGYYIENRHEFTYYKEYIGKYIETTEDKTMFKVNIDGVEDVFEMALKGMHNISNALGVIAASKELNVKEGSLKDAIRTFLGIGRRSELKAKIGDVMVYDDYAHHPTEVAAVVSAFNLSYPNRRIITVIEPHQISRLNLFHKEFAKALAISDYVIITKVFVGREKNKNLEPMDINDLVDEIGSSKAVYIPDFDEVAGHVAKEVEDRDVILVLGAGDSYKLTQKIIHSLNCKKQNQ